MSEKYDLPVDLLEDCLDKVRKGETNGQVQEVNLVVTVALYNMVDEMRDNPALIFGKFFKRYPALFVPSILVSWALVGATVVGIIAAFVSQLGIAINLP